MSLYEQILQTNLINFIIVVSTLILIFKKAKLGLLIEKMAQDVKIQVEKSSLSTKEALDNYKEMKKSLKTLGAEQDEIIENAKTNAQNLKEKIEQNTKKQTQEIQKNLEKTVINQKEEIKNLTVKEIYLASVELARKEAIKRLNPDIHKKLINSSIEELDKIQGGLL